LRGSSPPPKLLLDDHQHNTKSKSRRVQASQGEQASRDVHVFMKRKQLSHYEKRQCTMAIHTSTHSHTPFDSLGSRPGFVQFCRNSWNSAKIPQNSYRTAQTLFTTSTKERRDGFHSAKSWDEPIDQCCSDPSRSRSFLKEVEKSYIVIVDSPKSGDGWNVHADFLSSSSWTLSSM